MDFGITIPCYRGDVDLVVGLLESIKDFYPDTPICLIPDGYIDSAFFKRKYGCLILDPSIVHPELRAKSYGYGLTKMLAFWYSPFERFLHIDADAVCWGDFFEPAWLSDADMVVNNSHEIVTDKLLREQYFDVSKLPPIWSALDIDRSRLFNTGTFGSRRGLFSMEFYLKTLDFMRDNQGAIFTDQGILNIFVMQQHGCDQLRFKQRDLQVVVPVVSFRELKSRFVVNSEGPLIKSNDKRLIHWAGPKPRCSARNGGLFTLPMDYYRMKSLGLRSGVNSPLCMAASDVYGKFCTTRAKIGNRLLSGFHV